LLKNRVVVPFEIHRRFRSMRSLRYTKAMPKRKLRIVKEGAPMIGVCERCNSQFKAASEQAVTSAFDAHKCKLTDSSQNALRIVREATENK
jgi:hypothetical protein